MTDALLEPPPPTANRRSSWPASLLRVEVSGWRVLGLLTGLVVLASVLGYLGPLWWPFENLGVFALQYALALIVAAMVWLVRRRWWASGGLLALALLQAVPVARLSLANTVPAAGTDPEARLRLVLLNVHTDNREHDRVVRFLAESGADAVLLEEVNDRWVEALRPLHDRYPHRTVEPRADNFGIALFSRRAPVSSRVRYFGDAGVPSIVAQLKLAGGELTLVGTHPVPPVNGQYVGWRNRQVEDMANFCGRATGPLVIAGDLNMTERSPGFRTLLRDGRLHDSRLGFGVHATWPVQLPMFLIPLDHCLVSREVAVLDRRVGPAVGSDHYPVVVDLALR
jgi:endonuclease/exonuclease/phosphatase (EEP) superfamily protein YafD